MDGLNFRGTLPNIYVMGGNTRTYYFPHAGEGWVTGHKNIGINAGGNGSW